MGLISYIPWGQIALFYPQILSKWPDIYVDYIEAKLEDWKVLF